MTPQEQADGCLRERKLKDWVERQIQSTGNQIMFCVLMMFLVYSLVDHPQWPEHFWAWLWK